MEHLKEPAVVQSLPRLIALASQFARKLGFDDAKISDLELALEEAVTNVCRYAYGDEKGHVEVRCFREDDGDRVIVEVRDSGKPFDPLAVPLPDLAGDIGERPVGGLGIFFIRTLTDEVEYHYSDHENILRMAFYRIQDRGAEKQSHEPK